MSQNNYGAFPAPNSSGDSAPQYAPTLPDPSMGSAPLNGGGQAPSFANVPGVGGVGVDPVQAGVAPAQSTGYLSIQKTSPNGDYYREMRGEKWRWWMPLITGPALYVFSYIIAFPIVAVYMILGGVSQEGFAEVFSPEQLTTNPWAAVFSFGSVALYLLAVLFVLPLVERRRIGSVSSILGRLRWGIVAKGAGIALLVNAPILIMSILTDQFSPVISENIAWIILAFLIFLPLQCAAEEYVFRGWLLQTLGGWRLPLWLGALISALLFTAIHSQFEFYGYISTFAFGLCLVLLTIYTGGLEAAIAMHTFNNALGVIGMFIWGDDPTNDQGFTLEALSIEIVTLIAFTLLAAWIIGPKGQGLQKIQWGEFIALRPRQ